MRFLTARRRHPAAKVLLLLFALFVVLSAPTHGRVTTLSGAFVSDAFSKVMKSLVLLGSASTILLAHDFFKRERIDRFEFPVLIVLCTIGMMVMVSANDLIALYLGLELQSLAAYVIAAFHRDDARSHTSNEQTLNLSKRARPSTLELSLIAHELYNAGKTRSARMMPTWA